MVEIADIFRLYGGSYKYPLNPQQKKTVRDIQMCRTAALGGHIELCENHCGYARIFYHSCRNRHCPKCQSLKQAKWLKDRMERLLPTPYFHMVFTLPHTLNPLVLQNNEILYNLLFHAASNALLELAKGYSRLGAQVGFTAVLHTWKQDLGLHPHVHIVVTAGGLHPCQDRWIASKNSFFLPVKALSKIFKAKFLQALNDAFRQESLTLAGKIQYLNNPKNFNRLIRTLRRKKWVVYSKKPLDPSTPLPISADTHIASPSQTPASLASQIKMSPSEPGITASPIPSAFRRVYPTIPPTRTAKGLRQNPTLWPPRLLQRQNQTAKGSSGNT